MSTLKDQLALAAKQMRRAAKPSPMHFVFRRLRSYGLKPETFRALEAFGGTGANHTPDINESVTRLDVWDINVARRDMLHGYHLEHIFFERRWTLSLSLDPMYYCVLTLRVREEREAAD
jgi:hypothetical protein